MIQEDKELLLKDLSSRLSYGVKCDINDDKPYTLSSISNDYDGILIRFKEQKNGLNMEVYLSEVKPYLLPLSSMTKEQRKKLFFLSGIDLIYEKFYTSSEFTIEETLCGITWLIKNHFDINGLIPMGLAIDATNLNIY